MATIKYIKRFTLIIVLLLCFQPLTSLGQNVDDYVKEALKNNPGVKAIFSEYLASLEKVPQIGTLPDPEFAFGIFLSPLETRAGPGRARFSYMQMFPWIGTLQLRKDAASFAAKARYEAFKEASKALTYKVKKSLFRLYELNRAIDITQENIDALESYESMVSSQSRSGDAAKIDAIRIELMLIKSESELKVLQDRKRPMEIEFNNLLNRDADIPISTPTKLGIDEIDMRDLRDSLPENPRIKEIELNLQAARVDQKIRNNEGLPMLGAGLDYLIVGKSGYNVTNNGSDALMLKFAVTIPMFRKKYDASIRESKRLQEAYSLSKDNIKDNLLLELEDGLYMYRNAWEKIKLSISEIDKTDEALELLVSEYLRKRTGLEEVLRMQQQKLQYNLEKEKAISDLNIAIAKIEYVTGK